MNNKLRNMLAILISIISASYVFAASTGITITFVIPTATSHSISTRTPCTVTDFACRESDATLDGTQDNINITLIDGTECQTSANSALTITNDGNAVTNVSINSTALPAGVELKAMNISTGWQNDCTRLARQEFNTTSCKNITNVDSVLLAGDLAKDATEDIWMACDFTSFNAGVATSGVTRTLNISNT